MRLFYLVPSGDPDLCEEDERPNQASNLRLFYNHSEVNICILDYGLVHSCKTQRDYRLIHHIMTYRRQVQLVASRSRYYDSLRPIISRLVRARHVIHSYRRQESLPSAATPTSTMTISTHVLDTSLGKPAEGVPFKLFKSSGALIGSGTTNSDGRTNDLSGVQLEDGIYRMVFDTASYFEAQNIKAYFYPKVEIFFYVADASSHYHVPLILSPFGFSTYRGS